MDGLFDELEVVRLEPLDLLHGLERRPIARVGVDHHVDAVGRALAYGPDHLLVEPRPRSADLDLDRPDALLDPRRDLLDAGTGRSEREAPADEHLVVDPAAEQVVDGLARDLAGDVPQRHLHGRLGRLAAVHRAIHRDERLPNVERVRVHERGAEEALHVVGLDGAVAAVVHGDLAETLDARVRRADAHDPEVADAERREPASRDHRLGPRRPNGPGLDRGDRQCHGRCPSSGGRRGPSSGGGPANRAHGR